MSLPIKDEGGACKCSNLFIEMNSDNVPGRPDLIAIGCMVDEMKIKEDGDCILGGNIIFIKNNDVFIKLFKYCIENLTSGQKDLKYYGLTTSQHFYTGIGLISLLRSDLKESPESTLCTLHKVRLHLSHSNRIPPLADSDWRKLKDIDEVISEWFSKNYGHIEDLKTEKVITFDSLKIDQTVDLDELNRKLKLFYLEHK